MNRWAALLVAAISATSCGVVDSEPLPFTARTVADSYAVGAEMEIEFRNDTDIDVPVDHCTIGVERGPSNWTNMPGGPSGCFAFLYEVPGRGVARLPYFRNLPPGQYRIIVRAAVEQIFWTDVYTNTFTITAP